MCFVVQFQELEGGSHHTGEDSVQRSARVKRMKIAHDQKETAAVSMESDRSHGRC